MDEVATLKRRIRQLEDDLMQVRSELREKQAAMIMAFETAEFALRQTEKLDGLLKKHLAVSDEFARGQPN